MAMFAIRLSVRTDAWLRYTPNIMRFAILLSISLPVFACGGHQTQSTRLTEGQTAPREDGFLARYNPCDCLLHREELSIEIRIGDRWTRVALSESDSVERRVSVLLNQMRRTPNKKQRIHGRLSDKLFRWAGDHYARQLILIPPPPTPDK